LPRMLILIDPVCTPLVTDGLRGWIILKLDVAHYIYLNVKSE
jgi:hypothetical protein